MKPQASYGERGCEQAKSSDEQPAIRSSAFQRQVLAHDPIDLMGRDD